MKQTIDFIKAITAITGLEPRITENTRYQSNSCIDNVLTNIESVNRVSSICIADHQGLLSTIRIPIKKVAPKLNTYREMKERNWAIFSNEIKSLNVRGDSIDSK
jgi:hypothetical protein